MEEAVPVAGGGQRKQLLAAGAHGGPPVQATWNHQRKNMVAVLLGPFKTSSNNSSQSTGVALTLASPFRCTGIPIAYSASWNISCNAVD